MCARGKSRAAPRCRHPHAHVSLSAGRSGDGEAGEREGGGTNLVALALPMGDDVGSL